MSWLFTGYFFSGNCYQGGVLVRSRETYCRYRCIAVVGLDRILGVQGICLVALIAAALAPKFVQDLPEFWLILGIAGLLTVTLVLFMRPPFVGVGSWLFRIPLLRHIRSKVYLTFQTLLQYRAEKPRLALGVGLSMLLQLAIVIQYVVLVLAFEIRVPKWELGVLIPVVTLIALLPITINGIGLRENALAILGESIGLTASDAILLAWTSMTIALVYSLLGGLIYLKGKNELRPVSHAEEARSAQR